MSLQSRPKEKTKMITPAPGEYNINHADKMVTDSAPKYTFGLKGHAEKATGTPGKIKINRFD